MAAEEKIIRQTVTITDRRRIALDGVISVRAFDGQTVVLETAAGDLTVEGAELKIEDLDRTKGDILITGQIFGVFYDRSRQVRRGLFGIFS